VLVADYAFVSLWELEAPIDRVWEEISRAEQYPEWFPYVAGTDTVQQGDDSGVGAVTRTQWRTALPYRLVFEARTTRAERPHILELTAGGDLEGAGRWELSEEDGVTRVRYFWTVRTTKAWMNLLAPVARPVFGWNHAILMRTGGEGLARRLGARLVRNESFSADSTNPLAPLAWTAGLISLTMLTFRTIRRLLRDS
jgi:uncharacterized protein YndB with AHSA1/START domain